MIKNIIRNWIKKDKYIIITSVVVGFFVTSAFALYTKDYSDKVQSDIANKVIRFHVLANSNSDIDQNLKLKVRDGILESFGGNLEDCKNVEESRIIIQKNIKNIENRANEIIKSNGFNYYATASLENSYFPTKYYGNLSFPVGEYEALKIEIGEAEGENWWCVMFPPLCFVDITQDKTANKQVMETQEINKQNLNNNIEEKYNDKQQSFDLNNYYGFDFSSYNTNDYHLNNKSTTKYNNDEYLKNPMFLEEQKSDQYSSENIEKNEILNDKDETEIILEKENIVKDLNTEKENLVEDINVQKENLISSDSKKGYISEKSDDFLKSSLTEEEYNLVAKQNDTQVKVKFKIVEFWQKLKLNRSTAVVKK